MMQTEVDAQAQKLSSFPLRKVLPDWLQALGRWRTHEGIDRQSETLLRDAARALKSRQHAGSLGDCVTFGVAERSRVRTLAQGLDALGLDDAQVLALDAPLTPALRQQHWLRKASVVWIGRDLQAPTDDVLRSVEPLLHETVVVFERWNEHEHAFATFLRAHPTLTARTVPSDETVARSFLVTRALTV